MSKRQVAYVKPREPAFLRKLKEQIGYKEGPTVDTKRENLGAADEGDFRDTVDEGPTVVVLKEGDLTAEQAAAEEEKLRKEADETPADLTERVIFKSRKPKPSTSAVPAASSEEPQKRPSSSSDSKPKKQKTSKAVLSFNQDEEEDDS